MSSPIADLSYRGYDGPLESPRYRWWVIARMSVRLAFKKKIYWVLTGLTGTYYLGIMLMMFVMEQISLTGGGQSEEMFRQFQARIVWKDQFLHAISFGQLWYLFLALLLGAGSIANDNRANALLVYLSKPANKTDYIVGKWMGVFLPLLISMAIPTLVFWFYGALSYRPYSFLSADPLTIFKLALILPICAAFYSSLVIFFSSLFKQGRIAGATMAGLYFLTNIFTTLISSVWAGSQQVGRRRPDEDFVHIAEAIKNFYYASIDGLNIGITKAILGTDGSPYFGIPSGIRSVPAPSAIGILSIMLVISLLCIFIAWKRIRAVEVVG